MYREKIIKKIPGEIPPIDKKASQGYIEDLSKKTKVELDELLNRQDKLLSRKHFIMKLPDKGEKIMGFRDKIQRELDHRNEIEKAAALLSRLNIASEGREAMSELEWTGKYTEKSETDVVVELDSEDEATNPLEILAQPTGSGTHRKKIIRIPKEESLIKSEDLKEIESFSSMEQPLEEEHVKYIVKMVESGSEAEKKRKTPFLPYKTTRSGAHDPAKERERVSKDKHWEVTAATPPLIVHGAVKSLTLNESLRLQKEQADKLQEVQAKHAAERLAEQLGLHTLGSLPVNIGSYRTSNGNNQSSSSDEDEDDNDEHEQVHDEEDQDKGGTVIYPVDAVET